MSLPDFDTLMAMAAQDEGALDTLLRDEMEEILRAANPELQRQLTGLQFQIDCQKRLARNPIDCCVRLTNMLRKHCRQMRWLLEDLQAQGSDAAIPAKSDGERDVVPLFGRAPGDDGATR